MTPGSVHDLAAVKKITAKLKYCLFVDRGYVSKKLGETLRTWSGIYYKHKDKYENICFRTS